VNPSLPHAVLGRRVHIDLVARQDGDGTNELPAVVEHKEPRSLRLPHVLEPLPQKLPGVLPAARILVGRCPVHALAGHGSVIARRPSFQSVPLRFCPPTPPLVPPIPLLLSPNPALKYSVLIPTPFVPQGKRGNERLRNLHSLLRCGRILPSSPAPIFPGVCRAALLVGLPRRPRYRPALDVPGRPDPVLAANPLSSRGKTVVVGLANPPAARHPGTR
jgi:hypothetical protein